MTKRRGVVVGGVVAVVLVAGLREAWSPGPEGRPAEGPAATVATPGVVRFVALGDTGEGNASERKVARAIAAVCAARGCDFGVLLGDNLYPNGMDAADDPDMDRVFTDVYRGLPFPFYAALGNHDYGAMGDVARAAREVAWSASHPKFVLPAATYAFDAGPARLWALDTTWMFWFGADEQARWVDATVPTSAARWKVAFGHHPYRSNGRHGNAGVYEGVPDVPYASGAALDAFFRDHVCGRFDLYLAGHDHNQQEILDPTCATTLVIAGSGSKTTEIVDRGNDAVFASSTTGFTWIELGDEMRVAFYDADGAVEYESTRPPSRDHFGAGPGAGAGAGAGPGPGAGAGAGAGAAAGAGADVAPSAGQP